MDYKIELIPISVTDIDRTKAFFEDVVGWPADQDQVVEEAGLRFVQITPPGSACSFCFVKGMDMLSEGAKQYIQVVVADADAAYAELKGRGVEVTEVEDLPVGPVHPLRGPGRQPLRAPGAARLRGRPGCPRSGRCGRRRPERPRRPTAAVGAGRDGAGAAPATSAPRVPSASSPRVSSYAVSSSVPWRMKVYHSPSSHPIASTAPSPVTSSTRAHGVGIAVQQ